MKTLIIFTSLVFLTFTVSAQEWHVDFAKATEEASRSNKKIILVFQGSDWCAPCIKLDRKIWSTELFKTYAKTHFVLLKADFPRRKKNKLPKNQEEKNQLLAEKYNQQGYFPLVLVLDKKGKVLGQLGYENVSPKEYINRLSSF
ncbi:MAG: thioredoxin family protein [Polaribacter sp.]|nr:thioredoxin family protein [Polaribacter sp.]